MDFTFVLPRNNKDLLEDGDCTQYYVKQQYNANEIPNQLKAANQALQNDDAFYIFDHFDTFFSVIAEASQLQIRDLIRAIDILYRTTENLGQMLDAYLKQETLDRQNDFLNLTKMVMYLMVSTVKEIDTVVKNYMAQSNAAGAGRKKKNTDDQLPHYASYDTKRHEVLVQVCNIMQLPIEKLWNMSIVEEDFVNLLCGLAYRSLTHPSTKEKRVNDAIFQILGVAIKQYRHGIAFPVQIVEIMDREESAVVPIARGVRYLNDEFGITSVMSNLLKELIDKVNVNPASQTTSKNLGLFITEIGEISPALSLQCLEMAQELLNVEPYGVRNSLFGVMNIIIVNHLSGEDLNDEQRTLRDECLEDLWTHMNDANSYARSKVLQILNDLKHRDAVPLAWILRIVIRAVERLEDKTATVRKNAVTLLKSFLESNPFSAKLSVDEVEEKLHIETEKARVIREKFLEQEKRKDDVNDDYQSRCAPALQPILEDLLNEQQRNIDNMVHTNGVANDDDDDSEQRVQRIRDLLKDGEFETVSRYIIQLDACNLEMRKTMTVDAQVLYFKVLLNSYLFDDYTSELEKQDGICGFLQDSLEFSKALAQAVPKVEEMLMSRTATDVLEAIEFFKTGYLFKIKGTENGMRMMLRLLYISTGQDKNEKGEAVIKAYHSVLFGTDATGRAHHIKVVDNLYHFLQNITIGEYTAFELMIKNWVQSDEININVINVMFERFTLKLPETSSNFARCCMELLILVSNAKPAVAHNNKKLITDIISSRRILEDPRIFSGCLQLLMNSIQPNVDNKGDKISKLSAYYKRLDDRDVIDGIISNFKQFFFYPKLPDFELIASQTINFLYKMCYAPDLLCQDIIHDICRKLNEISQKRAEKMMEISENGVESSQKTETYIPKYLLPRIIFIFGHIASKELVYLDNDVYLNIKHREELKREKKEKNTNNKRKSTVNLNASASETLKRLSNANTNSSVEQEQDEAYMGATAEDTLAEMINNICENQLIGSADGLLHHFVPILTEILKHPGKYPDQHVQRAAVLTLMRFMVVSATLCGENIAFLMNILKNAKSSSMKCNIIIGLADLTSRFANIIEPWQPNFYLMLLETDEIVRLTAMKMLSYVILQAIVRVTGEISNMAGCIVDENPEIRNAAKEFFRQLIESKELEYYKIMPDIISRLSQSDTPIAEDKFHAVMKYLLELIQKDRQVETLVEKLCTRFRTTNTERQWRDVAFCLSLLNHTEKTMKKLLDHFSNYKDKVQYDEIYDCFKTIISNANKHALKPELKNLAKELDQKITASLQVNENGDVSMDQQAAENAAQNNDGSPGNAATASQPAKKDVKKRAPAKPSAKQRRLNRFARAMSSDDDDDDDDDNENSPPPQRGKAKGKNGKNAAAVNNSTPSARGGKGRGRGRAAASESSESSEESDDEPQPVKPGRRGRR